MLARVKLVSLAGIGIVPIAAYYVPYVPELVGALLAMIMIRAKPGSPIVELGLGPPQSGVRTLALGISAGIALVLINRLLLTPAIEHLTGTPRDLSAFDYLRGNLRALTATLPAVWVFAGLCEEIVYRAYLIGQAAELLGRSRLAQLASLVFAAILFALAHWYQGSTGMMVTGTLAILFGLLFLQQRGNLWANVIAHVVGDTLSLSAIAASWDRPLDALGHRLFFGP